jgi:MATE family multidrug resistance protein
MSFHKKFFSDYNKAGGVKELLFIALPMIISTACDGVMTFTDRLFLARVGSEQMNAAMGGGVTMQMLMFFFVGLTGYTTALVAQYFGANQKSNTTVAAFQGILITLLAWPIILMLKPLSIVYFHFMNIPASQIGFQIDYLNILAWGSIFGLMRYTLGCYFTGIGKTKIVMQATIAAMIVNVGLDYVLIFGKLGFSPMGVKGAAIATILGAFAAMVILIVNYLNHTNRKEFAVKHSFRFNPEIMKKLLYYGYPAGLELFLNFFAFATMVSLFHSQGDHVATASTIMFNWDLMSFIPLLGIEIAVTSLVGRYMGAGRPLVCAPCARYRVSKPGYSTGSNTILFVFVPEHAG